jgi:fatty-acid desaturase
VIANEGEADWNYWSLINVAAGVWLVASATFIPAISVVSTAQTILGAVLVIFSLAAVVVEIAYHRTGLK